MKVTITAHPRAKENRVEKELSGELHVYVTAQPREGKANEQIAALLAKYFETARSNVELIAGKASKIKTFEVYEKYGQRSKKIYIAGDRGKDRRVLAADKIK